MIFLSAFEIDIWNAWIFMIWWIIISFSSGFLIKDKKVYERLKASVPMKYEKLFNITTMATLIIGFIYSIFLPIKFNSIWFYIGLLIFLFGFFFDLSTLYTLRNAKPNRPFTNGSYRYSRHPAYFGFILIYISISIMSLSLIFFILAIIFTIQIIIGVPAEERYCLETYGKEYQEYMARTPRWIGLPKSSKK